MDLETRFEVIIAILIETQKLATSKSAMTKDNSKCNIAIINTELSNHDGRQRRHDVHHHCTGVQGAS